MFTSPPFAAVHSLKLSYLSRTDLFCTQNEHILEAVLYGFRINQRLCGLLLIHKSDSRNKNGVVSSILRTVRILCLVFRPGNTSLSLSLWVSVSHYISTHATIPSQTQKSTIQPGAVQWRIINDSDCKHKDQTKWG